MYTSTTEYNEQLHEIQRTLWDIKNEATQLAKRLVDDLPNKGAFFALTMAVITDSLHSCALTLCEPQLSAFLF